MEPVVLITVDCLRADHVGCYGYDRPTTPNIDSFADGDDATIDRGFANCPGTAWAFQTLHGGVYTFQVEGIGLPATDGVTLAEALSRMGYATGGFAYNGFVSRQYNYDRGFDAFFDVKSFGAEESMLKKLGRRVDDVVNHDAISDTLQSANHYLQRAKGLLGEYRPNVTDEAVCDRAIEWIRSKRDAGEPYFAWIHLMDAHTPYGRWPDHLRELRGAVDVDHVINPAKESLVEMDEDPPQAVIDAYDAGIRSADDQVGRILQVVDSDAAVLITGDHGEEFGRFNPFHTASPFSSMTRVPVVSNLAAHASDFSVNRFQHLDVPPTLVALAVRDIPDPWEGVSLVDHERDDDAPVYYQADALFERDTRSAAVKVGNRKLITDLETGEEELYHSVYDEPDSPVRERDGQRVSRLSELLDDHLAGSQDAILGEASGTMNDVELNREVRSNLKDLGYLD